MIEPQLDTLNLTFYPDNERFNLTDMTVGEKCTNDADNLDVGLYRTYFDYIYDSDTQTYLELE